MMMESFEASKTPTYIDGLGLENAHYGLMDPTYEYLQYPSSPQYMPSMTLAHTSSPSLGFDGLNLSTAAMTEFSSPVRPYTPLEGGSVSPPLLSNYHLSGGEMSSDSRGSGTHSPPHGTSYAATVPRSHRFNPMGTPPPTRTSARGAAQRRRSTRSQEDSEEDDDDFQLESKPIVGGGTETRRESIRKQRIESEQRRRDELRDGYSKLRAALPPSSQKASKVNLLDRATTHIRQMDTIKAQLEASLKSSEREVNRLRGVNEALMLGAAAQRHPSGAPQF